MKQLLITPIAALLLGIGCLSPPEDAARQSFWNTNSGYDSDAIESSLERSLWDLEDANSDDSE